jgi:putative zinc finger/helix-turn-helix YgiT family protein
MKTMKCPFCSTAMTETKVAKQEIFKGKEIELTYPVWKCTSCGNELVEMKELEKAWSTHWDQYEKEHGIPGPEELKKSREKLGITGEELAKVLGRTKSLISKLENGERRLSDKLLKIYHDYIIPGPKAFSELIAKAKFEGIISEVEFQTLKAKVIGQAVEQINKKEIIILDEYGKVPSIYNGFKIFSAKYFLSVLNNMIKGIKTIDNITLFKLLFYTDTEHFIHFEQSLTGIRYLKNNYGPTPFDYSLLLSLIEEAGILTPTEKECWWKKGNEITADIAVLKKKDIIFINTIIETYYGRDLSKLSHSEPFWEEVPDKKIIPFLSGMIKSRIPSNKLSLIK